MPNRLNTIPLESYIENLSQLHVFELENIIADDIRDNIHQAASIILDRRYPLNQVVTTTFREAKQNFPILDRLSDDIWIIILLPLIGTGEELFLTRFSGRYTLENLDGKFRADIFHNKTSIVVMEFRGINVEIFYSVHDSIAVLDPEVQLNNDMNYVNVVTVDRNNNRTIYKTSYPSDMFLSDYLEVLIHNRHDLPEFFDISGYDYEIVNTIM